VGEAAESPKHRARKATSIAALAGILAFAAIAVWMRQNFLRAPPAHIQSLVVLPLENLSHDPEQEYFADGMTDALTTELARIGSLRVISRTSAMHFKGSRETLPQIGQQLKVDAVVEGSAARAGDRIRITAQLIETQTDHHLWAKSYERNVQDVLALQDEVARDIAAEIRIKLTPEDRTRLARSRPVNGEAHEAYLKGRYFWNKNTIDAPAKSLDYSRKAIEIDPELAPAYASLAQAYFKMGNDSALPSKEAYEKGRAAAQKALQLDDTLAEAHSSLADVKHLYEYDQAGADKEYMRAIELNPNSAEIHSAYSKYLMHMVRCDEAVAQARIAMEVDPLSIVANRRLGIALFGCGRNDEAIEQFQKTRELDPTDRFTPYWIAWAYLYKGMYEEAIEENKKMTAPGDQPDTNARWELGIIYAEAGKPEQAISILNELKESRKGGYLQASYVRPQMIAHLAAALGYKDEAMAWLEKSYQERDDWIVQSRVMQEFSILRSEPRYQNLLRRIGLPSP
jgi:TolB-like protein/Tfp pilus assembly protein PilF